MNEDPSLRSGLRVFAGASWTYIAASSPPHRSQYHSVAKFIVPHSLHLSVFVASVGTSLRYSGVSGAGAGCEPLPVVGGTVFVGPVPLAEGALVGVPPGGAWVATAPDFCVANGPVRDVAGVAVGGGLAVGSVTAFRNASSSNRPPPAPPASAVPDGGGGWRSV